MQKPSSEWDQRAKYAGWRANILAEQNGISTRHLRRIFQKNSWPPPHSWLKELRMVEAFELLATGLSIRRVAPRLGYKQVSHFSREFKRFHGCSPGTVKKRVFNS